MFTEPQRELFTKILDTNWQIKEHEEKGHYAMAWQMSETLDKLKTELKESMGEEAYNKFMDNGRKMFSPKNN